MRARLRGIFPPIATIFDSGGDVDPAAIASNVSKLMTTGLAGVLALGSNGEAPLLTDAEADRVLAAAREAVPAEKMLIAGTGHESTRATIAACRRAATAGADAVLVRAPAYYKAQMSSEALIAHFRAVADASPLPVLLYNLPSSGVVLTVPIVATLAEHTNIVGMKETSVDLERLGQCAAIDPDFPVLSGQAPVVFPALVSGAAGGILAVANVAAAACVALYDHTIAGRHDQALARQRALTPLAQLVTTVYGVAGLKVALELVGSAGGAVRPPLLPAPASARQAIAQALAALG